MREAVRDPHRLNHILESIEKLEATQYEYDLFSMSQKDIIYFGIVKLLEIIGEASYKLTNEFRQAHPQTSWDLIIGMRHILVHGYYIVNKQDVIKTIKEDLPILKNQIISYLKEFDI